MERSAYEKLGGLYQSEKKNSEVPKAPPAGGGVGTKRLQRNTPTKEDIPWNGRDDEFLSQDKTSLDQRSDSHSDNIRNDNKKKRGKYLLFKAGSKS